MDATAANALRDLPSVDVLLRQPVVTSLLEEFPRGEVLASIRAVLDDIRRGIMQGDSPHADTPALALLVRQALQRRAQPNLRRVINATGIVLHTNLGRAPLAPEAIDAVVGVAAGYSNLELDLASGQRGDRHTHLRDLLRELTGAPDALVVNNNAAATFLALHTLGGGRGAIVSRGQLVEIGGSYRMPDIMAAAGCRLVEVGTTNRTHIADYQRAISSETAILLRVHTSNFRIEGFTATPSLAELVDVARATPHGPLIVIDDLGSGLMDTPYASDSDADPQRFNAWNEPTVRESVRAGADIVLFSGDKLLGGPQAGVILGRSDLIARIRKNPLMRTYRPDKLTLAAMEATLRLYRDPAALSRTLPIFRMLAAPIEQIRQRAARLAARIAELAPAARVACAADRTYAGGGSLPAVEFETCVVRLECSSAERLAAALRERVEPLIARIHADALLLDCRTLSDDELEPAAMAVAESVAETPGST